MFKNNKPEKAPFKKLTVSDLKQVAGGFGVSPHSLKGEDGHGGKLEIKPN
jgi:hypothetical protein